MCQLHPYITLFGITISQKLPAFYAVIMLRIIKGAASTFFQNGCSVTFLSVITH